MRHDDQRVGRLLTRRQALAVFRAPVPATLAPSPDAPMTQRIQSSVLPDCVAQPAQTEGPYFVDTALERSDIRVDPATGRVSAGVPLALRFVLSRVSADGGCAILPAAQVDVWHCDALGVYSDVEDRRSNTRGQQFLRGYQISDRDGVVRFTTIYPGWYPGRAVHVHFKVRVPGEQGVTDEFTSQLYFADELTDRVHALAPYNAQKGQRLLNARDMIFREGGTQLVLPVVDAEDGYAATYRIAMRPGVPHQLRFGGREKRLLQ